MMQHNWSADVVALGDRIAGLTVAQAALLNRYLADIHGIEPIGMAVVPEPQPQVIVEKGVAMPAAFDLVLEGCDPAKRITVIKAVRELLGLGLKESKDLVEAAPRVIRENLASADADKLKTQLEAVGARMALRPATV